MFKSSKFVCPQGADDILIVDLDKNRCVQEEGNELFIIPESLLSNLRNELINLTHLFRIKKDEPQIKKNISLCWIFLRFFLNTVGNYRSYLLPIDENKTNCFPNEKLMFMVNFDLITLMYN